MRGALWTAGFSALVVAAVGLGAMADSVLGGQATGGARSIDLQFGLRNPSSFEGEAAEFTGVVAHVMWDFGFILAYTAILLWLAKRRRSNDRGASSGLKWFVYLAVALVLLDIFENVFTLFAWNLESTTCGTMVYWSASLKWLLVPVVVVGSLDQFRHREPKPDRAPPPGDSRVRGAPLIPGERRSGICLSGGGIRSATFGLGAMHGLGNDRVRRARYLAAVSGGAYTAAAMTINQGRSPSSLPFGPGSNELHSLRARASFLKLNGAAGRLGAGRLVAATLVNLFILFLILFTVARPIGWLIRSDTLHPELRAVSPLVYDITPEDAPTGLPVVTPIALTTGSTSEAMGPTVDDAQGNCGDGLTPSFWALEPAAPTSFVVTTRTETADTAGPQPSTVMTEVAQPGVLRLCGPIASIVAQPHISVAPGNISDGLADVLEVTQQPQFQLVSDAVSVFDNAHGQAGALAEAITESVAVELSAETRLSDRPDIEIDGLMWGVVGVLATISVMTLGLPLGVIRGKVGTTTQNSAWAWLPPTAAAAIGAVCILLPWLMQELARVFDDLPSLISGEPDPSSTLGKWAALVVGAFASGWVGKVAAKRSPVDETSRRSRISQSLLKVIATGLLTVVIGLATVQILNQAAIKGVWGRPVLDTELLGWTRHVPDVALWVLAVVFLLALRQLVPAHAWSLHPLYRDRLAAAFLAPVAPSDHVAENVGYPIGTPPDPRLTRLYDLPRHGTVWPELVICCAANVNKDDDDAIPARRWADSMTFSPTEIGGPSIGYMETVEYVGRLSKRRQADTDIASLVATSGAAFSPAMGKFDFGAIGGLFAFANLRLGLWLPNPRSVRRASGPGTWRSNAGWPYLARELLGRFSHDDPFLYVTDGGHWENLGLVELLRRNCDEVYVVSAAGDGTDFYPTFGDAVALAREQTGIEIHLDPSPMRPRHDDVKKPSGRQLLRRTGTKVTPSPMADRPYAVGWFEVPEETGGTRRGRILFIEATLTRDAPIDVHTFAESHEIFPDHPTTNQMFDHRTFEAYRRLGEFQAAAAVGSPEWALAGRWVKRAITTDRFVKRLAGLANSSKNRPG